MYRYSNSFLLLLMILSGCSPQPVDNQGAIREEIENREIKRVTRVEILDEASKAGATIAKVAQNSLSMALMDQIHDSGISGAIEHCNILAHPLIDSISKAYDARIKRVSSKIRNPSNKPDSIESEIFDAYQYATENDLILQPNVQELDDEVILYSKPIIMTNPVCLNCHGTIGTDINEEDYNIINSLYPEDSAMSYKIGELRGMWSIRLLKKNLIRNMD